MPVSYLWERDNEAREAMLSLCLEVLEGGGPDPIRKKHLACVVDWALRERHRGDELDRVLRRYLRDARQVVEMGDALADGGHALPRATAPTSEREH